MRDHTVAAYSPPRRQPHLHIPVTYDGLEPPEMLGLMQAQSFNINGIINMKYFKHFETVNSVNKTKYFQSEGTSMCIPEVEYNTDYARMLEEVEAGTSTIEEVDDTPVLTYADNRRAAYASWGDQLDMQYHDTVDDTTTWKDHVASV